MPAGPFTPRVMPPQKDYFAEYFRGKGFYVPDKKPGERYRFISSPVTGSILGITVEPDPDAPPAWRGDNPVRSRYTLAPTLPLYVKLAILLALLFAAAWLGPANVYGQTLPTTQPTRRPVAAWFQPARNVPMLRAMGVDTFLGRLNVLPVPTLHDVVDAGPEQAVAFRQRVQIDPGGGFAADRENIGSRQSCAAVSLPPAVFECPVLYGVQGVVAVRVVPEVIHPIVGRVPVVVADFQSFGAWADEGFRHETVNPEFHLLLPVPETEVEVAIVADLELWESPLNPSLAPIAGADESRKRLDAPRVADLVAGDPRHGHGTPFLSHGLSFRGLPPFFPFSLAA